MFALGSMALRNVLRNRRRTLITLAALTIGVTAVGTIRAVLTGFQATIIASTIDGSVGALQIHRTGYVANVLSTPLTLDFPYDQALVDRVRSVKGVKAVAPRIQFAGSISLTPKDESESAEAVFFSATGLDPTLEPAVCPKRSELLAPGTTFDDAHVVVGDALAQALGAKAGMEAVLLAPDRDGSLNGELTHVGGALRAIMPGELKVALVPLSAAQRLLRMEGRVTELAVAVDDVSHTTEIAEALRKELGPEFEVHAWDALVPERKTILGLQTGISLVISTVFLLLMLLGVANTMLMSVLERTREVGTMMAVGLTRQSVLALFLLEALVLGVAGAALGLGLTAVVVFALSRRGISVTPPNATVSLEVFPQLTLGFTVTVLVVAMLGAVLFALYPALRASRLRPVQALAGR